MSKMKKCDFCNVLADPPIFDKEWAYIIYANGSTKDICTACISKIIYYLAQKKPL